MTRAARLYRVLSHHGITPREADQLEIWEVSAVLGIDDSAQVLPTVSATDLIRMRVNASQTGDDQPNLTSGDDSALLNAAKGAK